MKRKIKRKKPFHRHVSYAFVLLVPFGIGAFLIFQISLLASLAVAPVVTHTSRIAQSVPFVPQAPFGEWHDPIFEDGCEEASVLMAMLWVRGEDATLEQARAALIALAEFEKREYGEYRDTSSADTARLFSDYFEYQNYSVRHNIDAHDILTELGKNRLVIVPVNGQKLGNPYYTPPGPVEHMLVVIGFDYDTDEFITHDPGTRRGERWRYGFDVLDAALRDYRTGFEESNAYPLKSMIVVGATNDPN